MCKIKLQEKFGSNVKFYGRQRKVDNILLNNTSNILTEAWCKEKKSDFADEAECIMKTAAKLIENKINETAEKNCFRA